MLDDHLFIQLDHLHTGPSKNNKLLLHLSIGDDSFELIGAIIKPQTRAHYYTMIKAPLMGYQIIDDFEFHSKKQLPKVCRQSITESEAKKLVKDFQICLYKKSNPAFGGVSYEGEDQTVMQRNLSHSLGQ